MKHNPWFKFNPTRWLADPHLRMCSPQSHGLLINLMAYAHNGNPYGYLSNGGMAIGPQEASRMLAWNHQTVSRAWAELEQHGRIARAEGELWCIPSMVKDYAYSLQQSELGKQGGNPALMATLKATHKPEKNKRREEKNNNDQAFTAIWNKYPSKNGKDRAMKAYDKAKKEGVTDSEIMEGIDRYIAYVEHQRKNGFADLKYKHGATWFHQRCWLDEYIIGDDSQSRNVI